MYEEFYKVLPPYGQFWLTLVILVVGGVGAWRGLSDRLKPKLDDEQNRSSSQQVPNLPLWLMMGPAHDAMGAIHDMAEEHRKTNVMLVTLCDSLKDLNTGQTYTHKVLEQILNNQELRPDFVPPAHPRQRKL